MRWLVFLSLLACSPEGGRRDGSVDVGVDAFDAGFDAGTDAADASDAMDARMLPDADPGDVGVDAEPPRARGMYTYERAEVEDLGEAVRVAFHPDGTYAVVLQRFNFVHLYDWETQTATRIDVRFADRQFRLEDIEFAPSGEVAYIVGYDVTPETGVIVKLDDATWRAAGDATAFTRLEEIRAGQRFTAIAYPGPLGGPAGDGRPVILATQERMEGGFLARIRELDPATDTFDGLVESQPTDAGCNDLSFVDNEFREWGIAIVCGTNGSDVVYYSSIGGIGEWRTEESDLESFSRIDTQRAGKRALAVSFGGRRVYRFQGGSLDTAVTLGFGTLGIWDVSFSDDGRRALIVGRAATSPLRGLVLEYRHNLFDLAEITDVSVPDFGDAPYNGDST
ncbi:MAG: hypothetical protein AAGE52_38285, partial [Myxococcota bacterium]